MISVNVSKLSAIACLFFLAYNRVIVHGFLTHVPYSASIISSQNRLLHGTDMKAFGNKSSENYTLKEINRNDIQKKIDGSVLKLRSAIGLVSASIAMLHFCSVPIAHAVSGGGLDFANLDITGQDFSNKNYKNKDFTQVIAKGTTFAKSNLQGCRFYKAYLVNADFGGADLRGTSLEDTSMDNASLKGANAAGAYFSASILDVQSIENADFSDAQFPPKVLPRLCERDDATGVNPSTGVETRESLMCL